MKTELKDWTTWTLESMSLMVSKILGFQSYAADINANRYISKNDDFFMMKNTCLSIRNPL